MNSKNSVLKDDFVLTYMSVFYFSDNDISDEDLQEMVDDHSDILEKYSEKEKDAMIEEIDSLLVPAAEKLKKFYEYVKTRNIPDLSTFLEQLDFVFSSKERDKLFEIIENKVFNGEKLNSVDKQFFIHSFCAEYEEIVDKMLEEKRDENRSDNDNIEKLNDKLKKFYIDCNDFLKECESIDSKINLEYIQELEGVL